MKTSAEKGLKVKSANATAQDRLQPISAKRRKVMYTSNPPKMAAKSHPCLSTSCPKRVSINRAEKKYKRLDMGLMSTTRLMFVISSHPTSN